MKTLSVTLSFLLITMISLTSCKKDRDNSPKTDIHGEWIENNLSEYTRRIKFAEDQSFFIYVTPNQEVNSLTKLSGTYTVQGDSLKVKIKERMDQEAGKQATPRAWTDSIYEKATFSIKNDTLTLHYITYPADAPVLTTAKFTRMISLVNDTMTK